MNATITLSDIDFVSEEEKENFFEYLRTMAKEELENEQSGKTEDGSQ